MTTDRELDLDALERKLIRDLHEWRPDHATLLRTLIQRVREAEAGREHAIHQVGVCSRECNRLLARIAQLERMRKAAQALADSGTLGHWDHKTVVRVDGDRALELGAALAAVDDDR